MLIENKNLHEHIPLQPWLTLSAELKIATFVLLLGHSTPISFHEHNHCYQHILVRICLTNRDFRLHALEAYYGQNTFIIKPHSVPYRIGPSITRLRSPSATVGGLIRRLQCEFTFNLHYEDLREFLSDKDSEWRYLFGLNPTKVECGRAQVNRKDYMWRKRWATTHIKWQLRFPNLNHLQISLVGGWSACISCLPIRMSLHGTRVICSPALYIARLESVIIFLQSTQSAVHIVDVRCSEHAKTECQYETAIRNYIKGLLTAPSIT